MAAAEWYFDYVSPFAYLQFRQFDRLPADLEIRFVPVLFAGLLKHFGHKGPAEIPLKRIHTYRFCRWYAGRNGIPFRMPSAHPFNPLTLLRETIRLDCSPNVIDAFFRGIFEQGMLPSENEFWEWCSRASGADLAPRQVYDESVKRRLREFTEAATGRGIYGVPAFACEGETFWGVDNTDLFIEFLRNPGSFTDDESIRLARLPIANSRPV